MSEESQQIGNWPNDMVSNSKPQKGLISFLSEYGLTPAELNDEQLEIINKHIKLRKWVKPSMVLLIIGVLIYACFLFYGAKLFLPLIYKMAPQYSEVVLEDGSKVQANLDIEVIKNYGTICATLAFVYSGLIWGLTGAGISLFGFLEATKRDKNMLKVFLSASKKKNTSSED